MLSILSSLFPLIRSDAPSFDIEFRPVCSPVFLYTNACDTSFCCRRLRVLAVFKCDTVNGVHDRTVENNANKLIRRLQEDQGCFTSVGAYMMNHSVPGLQDAGMIKSGDLGADYVVESAGTHVSKQGRRGYPPQGGAKKVSLVSYLSPHQC